MRCRAERLAVPQMVSAGNTVSPEHGGNPQILASQVLSEQKAHQKVATCASLSWTLQKSCVQGS